MMTAVPLAIPATTALLTVATPALLLLHTPPVAALVSVMAAPSHTAGGPAMEPASGMESTEIVFVAMSVPQLLETV